MKDGETVGWSDIIIIVIVIIIYSIYIALYNALSKALCEYYKLDSDFINLGFIMKHVFSILKRICTNTCKYISSSSSSRSLDYTDKPAC